MWGLTGRSSRYRLQIRRLLLWILRLIGTRVSKRCKKGDGAFKLTGSNMSVHGVDDDRGPHAFVSQGSVRGRHFE